MQGFRPGLSTTPKTIGQAHKELPFSTPPARGAQERQLAEKEALLVGPPPQLDGTRRWSSSPPPPRTAASTTTMTSSQQLTTPATARPAPQVRPQTKTVGNLELDLAGAGTPPPGRGPAHLCCRSAALAARSRSAAPPDPRGTTPPPVGRGTARGERPRRRRNRPGFARRDLWRRRSGGRTGGGGAVLGRESAAGAGGEARSGDGFCGDSCVGRGRGSASWRRLRWVAAAVEEP
nr:uncharacterized protein LOC127316168 [Lolium perenne]